MGPTWATSGSVLTILFGLDVVPDPEREEGQSWKDTER